ncbi:hypothetical protein Tco_0770701 [Tanacetum coccineum]|uniref:Reverse transcriptase domain-containing protein n=1 Tax=Tanacetum coccineum TaxID=301880 RepID=A0ABQ4ZD85_9ASTR
MFFIVLHILIVQNDITTACALDEIQVDAKLNFMEEPVEILDREFKKLKRSRIAIVKGQWNLRRGPEFTWEHEDPMKLKPLGAYDLGVATPRALVYASLMTSGDARSCYLTSLNLPKSLMQTVTLLKNNFKKEESRNIDREITLEKRINFLDNIVFKRDQSAQTVHILKKPRFFYDHTTKQALGFQNPFYLKKAQQLEPKLYDCNIIEKTNAIVIPNSEETLMLAEESRSKMLLKQKDPIMLEKKVNTTPVDYVNSKFFTEPTLSSRPTKVEVPKELPKVSMVNTSLKKLKHHLAGFDVVVKERTHCH